MRSLGVLLVSLAVVAAGCNGGNQLPDEPVIDLAEENAQLKSKINDQQWQITELKQQLARLRGLPVEHLDQLVQVGNIKFGRYTRAFDKDENGLDDGLRLYLVAIDQEGDQIKTAGEVEIELFDLAAPDGAQRLGRWQFDIAELRSYWLSGMWTDHFKFDLDWPQGKRPDHENLTVKLIFTESLTGKVFEIQKMIEARILNEHFGGDEQHKKSELPTTVRPLS